MGRRGGWIEPTVQVFGLGEEVGKVEVYDDHVDICVVVHESEMVGGDVILSLDPDSAPLFRMIANRLDEIAGRRKRRS